MVVPCLAHHLHRYHHAYHKRHYCSHSRRLGQPCRLVYDNRRLQLLFRSINLALPSLGIHQIKQASPKRGDTHAYPYGIGIERACECVVALSRLVRRLVKIKHNGYAGHEEEEEYNPELLYAAFPCKRLPDKAYYAKNKREHEIDVMSLVPLAQIIRKQVLVAET